MNLKQKKFLNWAAMILLPATLLTFTSCSSTSSPSTKVIAPNNSTAYNIDAGGGSDVILTSFIVTNTVVSVDVSQRRIGLKNADGRITTYKAGPEVTSFNQIRVGDQVKATVVEEMAMSLKPSGSLESLGGGVVAVKVSQWHDAGRQKH